MNKYERLQGLLDPLASTAPYLEVEDVALLFDPEATILFIHRYDASDKSPAQYSLVVLRIEDEHGWDRRRCIGLVSQTAAKHIMDALYEDGLRSYRFETLDHATQHFITTNHLPIEWHKAMKEDGMAKRVWLYSRLKPNVGQWVRSEDEILAALDAAVSK